MVTPAMLCKELYENECNVWGRANALAERDESYTKSSPDRILGTTLAGSSCLAATKASTAVSKLFFTSTLRPSPNQDRNRIPVARTCSACSAVRASENRWKQGGDRLRELLCKEFSLVCTGVMVKYNFSFR